MESSRRNTIKNLLKQYSVKPSKRLGQNFLIDNAVLLKIIKNARLQPKDIVLEIGPGIGNLTRELAKRAKKVIAIEKDPNLVRILNNELRTMKIKNVEIIQEDILKHEVRSTEKRRKKDSSNLHTSDFLLPTSYKVVANLPFYLTAPVIRKFLESDSGPAEMILVVQKEVAQRICAKPPNMSILAVSVQFYAKPEIISYISKRSFWPQPKVDAAILKISNMNKFLASESKNHWTRSGLAEGLQSKMSRRPNSCGRIRIPRAEGEGCAFRMLFFRIVRAGFAHPRKQLANNLSSGLKLDKPPQILPCKTWGGKPCQILPCKTWGGKPSQILSCKTWEGKEKIKSWLLENKINPKARAETLSLKDWLTLTKNFTMFF